MARLSKWKSTRTKDNGGYIALLRGVNVGGKNKLRMSDLAAMFAEAGCVEVRTYIQSGNVIFVASASVAKQIPAIISQRIDEQLGLRVPVVLRASEELLRIVENNPFLRSGADAATLHVAFLADEPASSRIRSLDPDRSPGDSFSVCGRHIYLCCPNGVARSKLTNAYFDSALATTSTARNWRTVMTLAEMTQAIDR